MTGSSAAGRRDTVASSPVTRPSGRTPGGPRRRTTRARQGELPFRPGRGGRRRGAGRKPKGERAGVPHRRRAKRSAAHPAHVTAKLRSDLPKLRVRAALRVLWGCMAKGRDRFGFRLCWFSIQRDHVHLLVEAQDLRALARGMQGLSVRFAKNLNKLWGRKGKVFADRYHDRPLQSPIEVRRALCYVLNNALHHGRRFVRGGTPCPDPYSAGPWFDGFVPPPARVPPLAPPIVGPRTWLLRIGWLPFGRIGIDEVPGSRPRGAPVPAATPFVVHYLSADLSSFPD